MAVTTTETDADEDRELDARAASEYLTVLEDVGRARDADGLYLVVSESGREYLVDTRSRMCECPDFEYRDRHCKHLRRVAFSTGRREIPAWIVDVDPQLGDHVDDVDDDTGGDREEPTRSERADFGGGESTGVQDL